MSDPNLLVIGAARSGTTLMHYAISQHPSVFMSHKKETNFFVFADGELDIEYPDKQSLVENSITNIQDYKYLFASARDEPVIGESSPLYLFGERCAERIFGFYSGMKLIAILRNPVDRLYSHFVQLARSSNMPVSIFGEVIEKESIPGKSGWYDFFIDLGRYSGQLERYINRFPASQLKVILYDDLKVSGEDVVKEVFEFLQVRSEFIPDLRVMYNKSGVPRSDLLDRGLKSVGKLKSLSAYVPEYVVRLAVRAKNSLQNMNLRSPQKISSDIRQRLLEKYYLREIAFLEDLLNRDLSAWRRFER